MKWLTKIGYIGLGILVAWAFAILAAIMFVCTIYLIEEVPTMWKELYG
jgi:hypothetical protein